VFSLGTLVALLFRLLFRTYGTSWPLEILVNVVGIGAMLAVARWLERRHAGAGRLDKALPSAVPS
jgi:OpgC protein